MSNEPIDTKSSEITWDKVFPPEAGPITKLNPKFDDEPYSKSFGKLCKNSPDQLHWWYHIGNGVQSSEIFECKWCHEINVD